MRRPPKIQTQNMTIPPRTGKAESVHTTPLITATIETKSTPAAVNVTATRVSNRAPVAGWAEADVSVASSMDALGNSFDMVVLPKGAPARSVAVDSPALSTIESSYPRNGESCRYR